MAVGSGARPKISAARRLRPNRAAPNGIRAMAKTARPSPIHSAADDGFPNVRRPRTTPTQRRSAASIPKTHAKAGAAGLSVA